MTRILLLIPFMLWLIWSAQPDGSPRAATSTHFIGSLIFLGGYVLLVLVMGMWGRVLARRVDSASLHHSVRRFNFVVSRARELIPAWFAAGLFGGFHWGETVLNIVPGSRLPLMLPATLIATAPAFAAWMGLWWSQYPADTALREQSLLFALEDDLPVHSPPRMWRYFASHLRLQVLFTLVPIAMILLLRDLIFLTLWRAGLAGRENPTVETTVLLGSSLTVFMLAPAILRHVLRTQSLPQGGLRNRLEEICRRHRLRYRDILLWRTDNNMGNAAVMGILPWVRYILLSDLLLETMTDEQIEAVFAHEVGHVVHRHMAWYVVLIVILMLGVSAPADMLKSWLDAIHLPGWITANTDLILEALGVALFFLIFGLLSRRLERQADVFAARAVESLKTHNPAAAGSGAPVSEYGASVFASALHRVAIVNNIPIDARDYFHGSIASRMNFLHQLAEEPRRAARFDRTMLAVYATLLAALCVCATAAWIAFQA